ncbi:hypothetical protein PVA48_13265 [Akkermansia sp. JRP_AM1]|uniref:hypothetical protein n=1 Tax=Akkermansia sp. JRP_AM1 TaxID=3414159 RepID=UPI003A6B810F
MLYQAIQQGMDRSVFLELLEPDNPEGVGVEDFLMKARTRAAVSAPVLGTVYEASQAQGYWFVTSEQLGGLPPVHAGPRADPVHEGPAESD